MLVYAYERPKNQQFLSIARHLGHLLHRYVAALYTDFKGVWGYGLQYCTKNIRIGASNGRPKGPTCPIEIGRQTKQKQQERCLWAGPCVFHLCFSSFLIYLI